ncbi:hypothetical protein LCGC14_1731080 [marine sediment metagenome]|uniref:Uncharacterized protein n=1 Tax=marine sediment metagenome TaxID=412755 RepID=A0A0F9JQ48_9ZZZZ
MIKNIFKLTSDLCIDGSTWPKGSYINLDNSELDAEHTRVTLLEEPYQSSVTYKSPLLKVTTLPTPVDEQDANAAFEGYVNSLESENDTIQILTQDLQVFSDEIWYRGTYVIVCTEHDKITSLIAMLEGYPDIALSDSAKAPSLRKLGTREEISTGARKYREFMACSEAGTESAPDKDRIIQTLINAIHNELPLEEKLIIALAGNSKMIAVGDIETTTKNILEQAKHLKENYEKVLANSPGYDSFPVV